MKKDVDRKMRHPSPCFKSEIEYDLLSRWYDVVHATQMGIRHYILLNHAKYFTKQKIPTDISPDPALFVSCTQRLLHLPAYQGTNLWSGPKYLRWLAHSAQHAFVKCASIASWLAPVMLRQCRAVLRPPSQNISKAQVTQPMLLGS